MPKLSDAIRTAHSHGGRRIGFTGSSAASAVTHRGLLVVTINRIDPLAGAAILADNLSEPAALERRLSARPDAPIGVEPDELTADRIQVTEEAAVDFVVFRAARATADALLSTKLEYVLRLPDDAATLNETDLRAMASLRPTLVVVPPVRDPLSVSELLELRKIGMYVGAPLAVAVESTASAGLLEVLRESGVVVLLLSDPADDAVAALQTTIAALPERSRRRDDDRDVLIPGVAPAEDIEDDFDDD